MSLQQKYNPVLELGKELNVTGGSVEEQDGVLKIAGTVKIEGHKNLLWDKIKEIGGDNPGDVQAEINVDSTGVTYHTVAAGETLSAIAAQHLGDSGRYMEIYNANRHQLNDPNQIQVGQEIYIPS